MSVRLQKVDVNIYVKRLYTTTFFEKKVYTYTLKINQKFRIYSEILPEEGIDFNT